MKRFKVKLFIFLTVVSSFCILNQVFFKEEIEHEPIETSSKATVRPETTRAQRYSSEFLRNVQEAKPLKQLKFDLYEQSCEVGTPWNPWVVMEHAYYFMR